MRLLLLFVALLSTTFATAQREHDIDLKPEVLELPNRDFYIASILDRRTNQEDLGMAQTGLGNRKTPANFPEPFVEYLSKSIARMLPMSDEQTGLIMQVNALRISESTTFSSERATAQINVDFLDPETQLSYGNFTAEDGNKGMDVTSGHGRRIMEVLTQVITAFAQSDWKNVQPKAVAAATGWEYQLPFERALYGSWLDLKNNRPVDDVEAFDLKYNSKSKFSHYVPYAEQGKKVKEVFAITNKDAVYLNVNTYDVGDYFVKSEILGRYIFFEDQFVNQNATAAFGLIGAAASLKHYGIILDTETGTVLKLKEEDLEEILAEFPDLMDAYRSSRRKVEDQKKAIEAVNARLLE